MPYNYDTSRVVIYISSVVLLGKEVTSRESIYKMFAGLDVFVGFATIVLELSQGNGSFEFVSFLQHSVNNVNTSSKQVKSFSTVDLIHIVSHGTNELAADTSTSGGLFDVANFPVPVVLGISFLGYVHSFQIIFKLNLRFPSFADISFVIKIMSTVGEVAYELLWVGSFVEDNTSLLFDCKINDISCVSPSIFIAHLHVLLVCLREDVIIEESFCHVVNDSVLVSV